MKWLKKFYYRFCLKDLDSFALPMQEIGYREYCILKRYYQMKLNALK